MSLLTEGKNPESSDQNAEVDKALLYAKGNRELAANQFLHTTLQECKNNEQRNAIETVTNVLEAYYYGKYNSKLTKTSVKDTPVMTMIGVPGAGKSWVIGTIRTWIDIRFNFNDLPYTSSEFMTLSEEKLSDPVSEKVRDSLKCLPSGIYGKSVALAFSGCADGVFKGFTVHHGFSFPINMNKQIKNGELPLPELKPSVRTKLLNSWCSVKLIIIDEVYTLKVEWLSLIDEKLRQIFNSNIPFAGIPILLSGDPRQIVPVNGKALFAISKYFNIQKGRLQLKPCGSILSEREHKGFHLYASSKFAIPITKSVCLKNNEFAQLNMKKAQYKLTSEDIVKVNKFYQPENALHKSPWIDSPWLFPTWKEVNDHLTFVTERAKISKGIFRAWCPVSFDDSQSLERRKLALKAFYKSSISISAQFTCPLPYIDFFVGQIVCLKRNWNPTWNLFNNAKEFVVGIKCEHLSRQSNPLMTLEEAIHLNLKDPRSLKYSVIVKPFIPFKGPSAIADVPGLIEVPWIKTNRKIAGCKLLVEGPCLFPANAFSHHQSQGSTFERSIACVNEKCKKYGMANVVTSRTPNPETFAITKPVTKSVLQPCPDVSLIVENEYKRLHHQSYL